MLGVSQPNLGISRGFSGISTFAWPRRICASASHSVCAGLQWCAATLTERVVEAQPTTDAEPGCRIADFRVYNRWFMMVNDGYEWLIIGVNHLSSRMVQQPYDGYAWVHSC